MSIGDFFLLVIFRHLWMVIIGLIYIIFSWAAIDDIIDSIKNDKPFEEGTVTWISLTILCILIGSFAFWYCTL